MTDVKNYAFYSLDLNGNGIVEGNGFNLPVEGEFPLQVGDTVRIYTRNMTYLGTDGAGGGIFEDPFDRGQVYGSDTVKLDSGDPFPDPIEEELPLNGGGEAPEPPDVPVISIAPAEVEQLEGNEGTTEYTFTVTRSGDELGGTSTVDVALDPGTADAADFGGTLPETQKLTFAPDETAKTVTFSVTGDTDFEPDETFEVSLEFATDATIDPAASSATGIILNDDAAPTIVSLAPGPVVANEGDDGTVDYTFTVVRSGNLAGSSSVEVAFEAGETDAADFGGALPETQTVQFQPDEIEKTVIISVSGDTDIEDHEFFRVNLLNATGAEINNSARTETGVIVNDDEQAVVAPVLSILPATVSKDEGNSGTTAYEFTVMRSGDLSVSSAVQVVFDAGDTNAADFSDVPPQTEVVFFAPGESSAIVTRLVAGDTDVEADETFTLSLQNACGATIDPAAGSATGTILNDDEAGTTPPVLTIAADESADQDEGNEGTTEFTFTVTRSGDLSGESTVDVDFFPGDTDADDFVGGFPETQTIQFAANEDTKTVSIPVSGDLDVEDSETFALTLVNPTNAVIDETANDAAGSIRNDDVPDLNVIDGTDEPDVLQGTDGNDAIRGFDENDILLGLGGNDIMDGGDDEDVLLGGEGNDILIGGNNSDVLLGGAGNDALFGGDGEDVLRGDEGNDILTGGLRSDAFQFSGDFGNDVITDADDNQDGIFFEGADRDDITTEVFTNGTLVTVESDITNGSVLLLGVTDVDEFGF